MQTGNTQIVILGGSGDLSQKKLIPALVSLYDRDLLSHQLNVIGVARTKRTDDEYRAIVAAAVKTHGAAPAEEIITEFCEHLFYIAGDFESPTTYQAVASALAAFEAKTGACSNKIFYVAASPVYYSSIFRALHESRLAEPCNENTWARILVEKPFGRDYETAQALDGELGRFFKEEQIFRIDHYLAKEAVQNILSFRFSNQLLATDWHKDSVEEVKIVMHETAEVGERTEFYESVGALRDVGQNHLLQLLALVAMRRPERFEAAEIRAERARVLEQLHPLTGASIGRNVVRGQYLGYRDSSETETYFKLRAFVDLPEWEGVPFIMSAGKAFADNEVSISIKLRDMTAGFQTKNCLDRSNLIRLIISPEQRMSITLNAKAPGIGFELENRTLTFTCSDENEIKNSYEKVLYDAIAGDHTLFTSTREVLAEWKFITPILEGWHHLPLYQYERGSNGPVVNLS